MRYSIAFEAEIGPEAIYNIFKEIDLSQLEKQIEERLEKISSIEKKSKKKIISC